jgi:hypothetical protein
MALGEAQSLLCSLTGHTRQRDGCMEMEDRHGAPVDWTEEEVEVSHSTFLSLLQPSSAFTILPSTSSIQYRASDGLYDPGLPLPVESDTQCTRAANIAFQYQTTRTFRRDQYNRYRLIQHLNHAGEWNSIIVFWICYRYRGI